MMKSLISVTKLKGCKLLKCNLDKDVDYQNENCGASARDQKWLANVSTKDTHKHSRIVCECSCFSIGLPNLGT
jgi:hypothetical protein